MKPQIARYLGLIILTVAALAVAVTVITDGWRREELPENNGSADTVGAPVSVLEARPESIEITDTYSGMIRPWERFSLAFEIAGRVEELGSIEDKEAGNQRPLDDGDHVSKGQLLARLDDRLLRSQLDEATAQCKVAEAGIDVAVARQKKALADERRSERMWQPPDDGAISGAISKAQYEDDQAALEVAEAQLIEAKAQLTRAEAQRATVRENIADTKLLAPVDGVISRRLINPGESVNPQQTILEILQVEPESGQAAVLLVVGVPEAYVGQVEVDQLVRVELPARDQFRQERPRTEGRIHRVAEAADQTTGLFEVEITLPNPDGRWRPGLIALAHIVLKEIRGFRVPITSAVFRDNETFVFTVDEQSRARRFDLENWIEQGSDLIVGELPDDRRTLVRRGQHRLVDGRLVKVVELPKVESGKQ